MLSATLASLLFEPSEEQLISCRNIVSAGASQGFTNFFTRIIATTDTTW